MLIGTNDDDADSYALDKCYLDDDDDNDDASASSIIK